MAFIYLSNSPFLSRQNGIKLRKPEQFTGIKNCNRKSYDISYIVVNLDRLFLDFLSLFFLNLDPFLGSTTVLGIFKKKQDRGRKMKSLGAYSGSSGEDY